MKLTNPKTTAILVTTFLAALVGIQCASPKKDQRIPANARGPSAEIMALDFPAIVQDDGKLDALIAKAIKKGVKDLSTDEASTVASKLKHYFLFLGLTSKDFGKGAAKPLAQSDDVATPSKKGTSAEDASEDGADKTPSNINAVKRIFMASTQFLSCPDLTDWDCLEQDPKLIPSAAFRHETAKELGKAITAGSALDMDVFFTEGWDGSPRSGLVNRFAERLRSDVGKSLSIAMYGIDDVTGSMKPVYDEIVKDSMNPGVNVRAVVDVAGIERLNSPLIYSYVAPGNSFTDRWLFSPPGADGSGSHITFEYDGTLGFISTLNKNITTDEQARVRTEWPMSNIMHNKFAVLENAKGKMSVWTGTANISNHCMGTEANANMSIYIRNDSIAQAYLDEFNHMYEFDESLKLKSKLVTGMPENGSFGQFKAGRFHHNKVPVSHRLFTFEDGTKVRVHFAPTDDAEHRVILPMLLSARAGDEIRISMFGGTGYEIVRAFQYAVAQGANIRIAFDSKLGHGQTSWLRDAVLNTNSKNPYLDLVDRGGKPPGTITVRLSTWTGKNHYKVGTLTRKQPDGRFIAEEIILGSQNWSSGGNDNNDENLVSIQNLTKDVVAAKKFNDEFDNRIWKKSKEERQRIKPIN